VKDCHTPLVGDRTAADVGLRGRTEIIGCEWCYALSVVLGRNADYDDDQVCVCKLCFAVCRFLTMRTSRSWVVSFWTASNVFLVSSFCLLLTVVLEAPLHSSSTLQSWWGFHCATSPKNIGICQYLMSNGCIWWVDQQLLRDFTPAEKKTLFTEC